MDDNSDKTDNFYVRVIRIEKCVKNNSLYIENYKLIRKVHSESH